MLNEFLFVYGTLRREAGNSRHVLLAQHCRFYGPATLRGLLYEVHGYPGAIESDKPGSRVAGELYRIIERKPLFALLDDYEECAENYPHPREYVRKSIQVKTADGETLTAWAYIYNYPVQGLTEIWSGDYLNWNTSP